MNQKRYTTSRPAIPMAIKREVKVDANDRCQICLGTSTLEFHHIDKDRENNIFDNIIYLCAVCHGRVHNGEIDAKSLKQYKNRTFVLPVNNNEDKNVIKKLKELLPWGFISSLRTSAYDSDFRDDTFFPFEYFLEECDNPDFYFNDGIKEKTRQLIREKIEVVFRIIGIYREEPNPKMYIIVPKSFNLSSNDPNNELRTEILDEFNCALLDIYNLYHGICK